MESKDWANVMKNSNDREKIYRTRGKQEYVHVHTKKRTLYINIGKRKGLLEKVQIRILIYVLNVTQKEGNIGQVMGGDMGEI